MCEVTKLVMIMLSLSLKLTVILGDRTAVNTSLFFLKITN